MPRALSLVSSVAIFLTAFLFAMAHHGQRVQAQSSQVSRMMQQLTNQNVKLKKDYLAIVKTQQGVNHADYVQALYYYGEALLSANQLKQATPVLEEALTRGRRIFGPNNAEKLLPIYNRLVRALFEDGNYARARTYAEPALRLAKQSFPQNHPQVAVWLNSAGLIAKNSGNFDAAIAYLTEAVRIGDARPGGPNAEFAIDLDNLSELYRLTGQYQKSLALKKRATALLSNVRTRAMQLTAISIFSNLATLHKEMGELQKAETLFRQVLEYAQRLTGVESTQTATSQVALGAFYWEVGRLKEAERLFDEALRKHEKIFGPEHANVAVALNNLAQIYQRTKRLKKAEPVMRRALAILEKVYGRKHPEVGFSVSNLGILLDELKQTREAESLFLRAIAIHEETTDREHPNVMVPLINLGELHHLQGRFDRARGFYTRALTIGQKRLGPNHPRTARTLAKLARLNIDEKNWRPALSLARKSTAVTVERLLKTSNALRARTKDLASTGITDANRNFQDHGRIAYQLARSEPARNYELMQEGFVTAQWALATSASQALVKMAARASASSPKLAELVRQQQDLIEQWRAADRALEAAARLPENKRDEASETAKVKARANADTKLLAVNARLTKEFPEYQSLNISQPLKINDVQSLLRRNEALILIQDLAATAQFKKATTLVWVISKDAASWKEVAIGGQEMRNQVATLRCGLDHTAWYGDGAITCADRLKLPLGQVPSASGPLPFSMATAHDLYQKLFGDLEAAISGKQLLIVSTGALTKLPFQALITEAPSSDDYAKAAWLMKRHAMTTLPAVSALASLRRIARPSAAKSLMIGFGNPLLDGDQGHPDYGAYYKKMADLARKKQQCGQPGGQKVASLNRANRAVSPVALRSGMADLAHLRIQTPLPETTDELCSVARALGASERDIHLGQRATENSLKKLSESGALKDFRIVHIATHGTLSGQVSGTNQPGLIFTPPAKASQTDDGYLSAEEIAGLKLDADWVILSACNTAAGDSADEGTEALSGLARGFFYAGARALLVSHWEVDSQATVKLITSAIRSISGNDSVGRAQALRTAMLQLATGKDTANNHPSRWAPFVVVGEGTQLN